MALSLFARLRVRMLAGAMRGRASRIALFVLGILGGVYVGGFGFLLFAASTGGDAGVRLAVASLGGGVLVIGAAVLPLVWFGVDNALDPARFALLPLSRTRLVLGLLVGALIGVPPAALLLATAGTVVPAAVHGGLAAALVQLVGVAGGVLLCVAVGQAMTSAFATMLRSRRVRDLAGILLAALAASLGPLVLVGENLLRHADLERLVTAARVVGWTPLGAPWTAGAEIVEGAPWAALAKLAITAGSVAVVLSWWSRTVESAMVGAVSEGRTGPARRGGPVSQLFPRFIPGLPPTRFGAMVARELRYWWRDAKRRANLISIAVVGVVMPVVLSGGGRVTFDGGAGVVALPSTPFLVTLTLLFVAVFASTPLANQFGFDGTAYAGHLIAGVPGGQELRARVLAYSLLAAPLLVVAGTVASVLMGDPEAVPEAWGLLCGGYGAGLAVNLHLSVLAPYALPEGGNPLAITSGTGLAKSLLALVGILAGFALASPLLVATVLWDGVVWSALAVPVGIGYGAGLALLGFRLAGDQLDRRAPELLAEVSPRR